jgi:hypothetical protein
VLTLNDVEPADAGADVHADAVAIGLVDLQAGVVHRLLRGGDGKVDEAAHLAGLFLVDKEQRVEVLDLGGEADGMAGEVEGLDLRHAAAAGQQALPDLRGGVCRPRRSGPFR